MSNSKCFLIPAIFLCLGLTAACTGTPSPEQEADRHMFQLRKFAASLQLTPEQNSGDPRINFNLTLLDVTGPENLERFFNTLLYDGQGLDGYRESLTESWQENYRSSRGEETSGMAFMNWDYTETMDLQPLADHWLVVSRLRESYTGGAHGNTHKTHYVVDLREPKLLTLEDLFTDPEDPGLYQLVQNALRKHARLGQKTALSSGIFFEDNPPLSPDFFLNRTGIVFHWDPYEISPFSAGHIEAALTWKQAGEYLSGKGRTIAEALTARP